MTGQFDLVVSTLSDGVELDDLVACVKPEGVVAVVGLPEHRQEFLMRNIVNDQKVIAGSNIGSIGKTQEVLDFCAEHDIAPQIEIISGDKINEAWDNVVDAKVRYRYVIDTSTF